jgi:phenylpropionate dioxygenase-like ring-hydroxylating dioxygenase large terminal subunit
VTDLAAATTASGGLLDTVSLVHRVLEHLDHGTTDLSEDTWREPVGNYRSEDRLAAEIDLVLRRYPTAFCPSAALPAPGSYLARDAAGIPLVAVRGHDDKVRVFRNSCRHRGTALAAGEGCAKSLVCPYHGWVYRLDGALRHVPDEYGFPGLDQESRGLVPVDAEEHGGVVFVTQDGRGTAAPGPLPELIAPDQEYLGSFEFVVEANWKIFLEGFLEGYHLRATHPETFLPFGYDNVNVVETFGRNSRVTFPFKRIEALRHRPRAEWDVDGLVTFVHQIFPNAIIAQLSHHTTMAILEPLGTDRTNLVTYQLTNRGPREDAESSAERDSAFVRQGATEDRAIACAVQRGLTSGANDTVEFGRFEGAIVHFHKQLTELLGTASPLR